MLLKISFAYHSMILKTLATPGPYSYKYDITINNEWFWTYYVSYKISVPFDQLFSFEKHEIVIKYFCYTGNSAYKMNVTWWKEYFFVSVCSHGISFNIQIHASGQSLHVPAILCLKFTTDRDNMLLFQLGLLKRVKEAYNISMQAKHSKRYIVIHMWYLKFNVFFFLYLRPSSIVLFT